MEITETLLRVLGYLEGGEDYLKRIWATEVKYLSEHVGIRRVLGNDRRWKVEIVVDSQVNQKDVLSVWSFIESEIIKVARIQGHDLSDYFQVVLQEWVDCDYLRMVEDEEAPKEMPIRHKLVKGKPQYRDLFMDANFDLLLFIIRISKRQQGEDRGKLAHHYFSNLLRTYQFKNDEVSELSEVALEEIATGRCPWDISDGPIDFGKFTNRLEYLIEQYGGEKRPSTSKKNLLDMYHWFVVWGDWNDALNLLRKTYPSSFEKYKPRVDARLNEILLHTNKNFDDVGDLSKPE